MTTLALDTPAVLHRFDRLCALIASRDGGLTMKALGQAHALARALEAGEEDRVEALVAVLGLEAGVLEVDP